MTKSVCVLLRWRAVDRRMLHAVILTGGCHLPLPPSPPQRSAGGGELAVTSNHTLLQLSLSLSLSL